MILKSGKLLGTLGIGLMVGWFLACSGGGGDDPDTTPPVVSNTSPADSATGVAPDAVISVTFNEAMDENTLDTSSISVTPTVSGSLVYESTTQRATLTPAADLADGTTYTVTVTTACSDAAGNNLAADHSFSFTTSAGADDRWTQLGGQVSTAGAESEDPTMLILENRPAVGYRHASFQVHLHHWNNISWGTTASDPAGGDCNSSIYHAPSFCSNNSQVYMAYSHAGDGAAPGAAFYDRIFVHRYTTGGGWVQMNGGEEVSTVWTDPPGGADADEAAITCGTGGDPHAAWVEMDMAPTPDSDDGLWVSRVASGSASRSDIHSRNDTTGDYATNVRAVGIYADNEGNVYTAQWESHHSDQDRTDLFVSQYTGSSFTALGAAVTDDYDYNNLCRPAMAVLDGSLYVAYTRANNSDNTQHVYVKKYSGGTWSIVGGGPVSAFSSENHYDSGDPDLIAANGKLWVTWHESDQYEGPFIFVARYDATDGSWIVDGDKLNISVGLAALDPSLAYSSTDGYLYVAFEENTDGHPHIFVKRKRITP